MREISVFLNDAVGVLGEMPRRAILAIGMSKKTQHLLQVLVLDDAEQRMLAEEEHVKVALTKYDPARFWYMEYMGLHRDGRTLGASANAMPHEVLELLVRTFAPYLAAKFNAGDAVADILLATTTPSRTMTEGDRTNRTVYTDFLCPRFLPSGGFLAAQGNTLCAYVQGNTHQLATFGGPVGRINRVRHDGETYYVLVSLASGRTERVDMEFLGQGIRCSRPYPYIGLRGIEAIITDSARQYSITIAVEGNIPIVRIRSRGDRRTTRPFQVITGLSPDTVEA